MNFPARKQNFAPLSFRINEYLLIHSAVPHSRPVVLIIFSHVSVRPHFSKHRKTIQSSLKIIITTDGTVGLAEWIIDGIYLYQFTFMNLLPFARSISEIFKLLNFMQVLRSLSCRYWLTLKGCISC